ncbi:MAG: hypothetical protein PSX36_01845 [bacterium]|nr:hypothetical protein [bacterium]
MSKKNQFGIAFPLIENYFDTNEIKAFSEKKLMDIYASNNMNWKISSSKSATSFISFLEKKGVLFSNSFTDESNSNKIIYSWKTKDDYTVISGLKNGAYYSHYSALFLHQLTLQIPKTLYLNQEHSSDTASGMEKENLTQEKIDKAFLGSQRKTKSMYLYLDKKIFILNGKKTDRLGVLKKANEEQRYQYTDLERTLIDISIRPVYAGGVFEVLEAYKKSKGKLNVNKLANYLKKLDFIYPYHQVIGFYLENAGYSELEVDLFEKNIDLKFYLTYDIRNKDFSERWRLYFPKGMKTTKY